MTASTTPSALITVDIDGEGWVRLGGIHPDAGDAIAKNAATRGAV